MTLDINLSNSKLSEIPIEIRDIRQLRELRLGNNQITFVPEWLLDLSELRILDLTENRLNTLPPLVSLTNLEVLLIGGNQISILPALPLSLRVLWIDRNPLKQIPYTVFELVNLQELDLTECCLEFVHTDIVRLSSLVKLYLSFNELTSLPDSLGYLPLVELCVFQNPLYTYPDTIVRLPLQRLLIDPGYYGNSATVQYYLQSFDPTTGERLHTKRSRERYESSHDEVYLQQMKRRYRIV
jgi:Leucine-rich repeat (LRR) protein